MNQSFEISNSSYHLPKLKDSELRQSRGLSSQLTKMNRSQTHRQIPQSSKVNQSQSITRKLVLIQDIKNVEEYDHMNEKELLREHQKLLKVLKKFQQIIDINLAKKQKEKEKASKGGATKQQIYSGEIANNKKIIQNYLRQIKELQSLKKTRKLHQVIDDKNKVNEELAKLKKEIFNLKNEDTVAGRSLIQDRAIIERELKEHQKDLKIQLTKKNDYSKRMGQLTEQLAQLKKQCQGLNLNEIVNQKSTNSALNFKLAAKKSQLEELTRSYVHFQESIHQNMIAKARRNKNVTKQIQKCELRIKEMQANIQKYKQKIERYQKIMQINEPKK